MLDSSKLETDPEVARRVPQGAVGDRRDPAGASSSSGVPGPEMSEYERQAWEALIRRRHRFLSRRARRLLPEPVRQRVTETRRAAADKAQQLPGAEQIQGLVAGVAKVPPRAFRGRR